MILVKKEFLKVGPINKKKSLNFYHPLKRILFEGVTNINVGTVTRLSIQSICLVHASKESNLLSTVVDTLKPSVFQNLARSEVKKTVLLPKKRKANKET